MIKIFKKYFSPLDINFLLGDPSKAKKELNYKPRYNFQDLVQDMLSEDINLEKKKLKID